MKHKIRDFAHFQRIQKKDLAEAFDMSKSLFWHYETQKGALVELIGDQLLLWVSGEVHASTDANKFKFAQPGSL